MITLLSLLSRVASRDLVFFLFNDTINNSEYSAFPGRITVTELNYGRNPSRLICCTVLQLRGRDETIPDNLQGVLRMLQSQVGYL